MNHAQFERYVRQYQDRVYGFAYYFLKDREEAQDVTQEVLIRFWEHREEVDEDRLIGWLLRVTRNACIDVTRKRKMKQKHMTVDTDSLQHAVNGEASPAERAEAADFRENLERAIEQIAEPYRSIVILREIQNMKYEEISGAMDMPLNTVKVYLHRGRKKLRKQLSEVMSRETV